MESCAGGRWRKHAPAPANRITIGAYLGSSDVFDRSIAQFASAYSGQTERDYKALVAAVASGRIKTAREL
jgi:hypothetical protein